jgi:hypothetical protein
MVWNGRGIFRRRIYKIMTEREIDDLDLVLISQAVWNKWVHEVAPKVAKLMARAHIHPNQVPEEQGRVEEDGSLTIFVRFPDGKEVGMRVPPGQWAWKQAN